MNTVIEALTKELNQTEERNRAVATKLREALHAEYKKLFEKDSVLKEDISRVECSTEYGRDEGGIYTWIRMKADIPKEEEALEAFKAFVAEYGFHVEVENEALLNYQGECLVIVDSGDVYLSDGSGWSKQVIEASQYTSDEGEDEEERNRLIEAWMEKEGYFPAVLRETRHGDVFPVNTQQKAVKV